MPHKANYLQPFVPSVFWYEVPKNVRGMRSSFLKTFTPKIIHARHISDYHASHNPAIPRTPDSAYPRFPARQATSGYSGSVRRSLWRRGNERTVKKSIHHLKPPEQN
jgi:hypothetical protein